MKAVRNEENNENQMVECHYNGSIIKVPKERFITLIEADAKDIESKVECHYNGAIVQVPVKIFISTTMGVSLRERKFVRYKNGAKIYGMSQHEFFKLAHDANAIYKRNKMALVNIRILDEFLEYYHEE